MQKGNAVPIIIAALFVSSLMVLNQNCSSSVRFAQGESIDKGTGIDTGSDVGTVGNGGTGGSGGVTMPPPPVMPPQMPPKQVVCDPFKNPGSRTNTPSISADVYYLSSDQPHYKKVSEYIEFGHKLDAKIYLSEIFVPTRAFSVGFPTKEGEILKTEEGHDLFEYFALRFQGEIHLAQGEEEGLYEFALLADDGAVLSQVGANGQLMPLVNNDGEHATRFACGQALNMQKDTSIKFQMDYFQGPRYHISIVPMWRKIDPSNYSADRLCGTSGNETFFNSNSQPTDRYRELESRGWKPIKAANYAVAQTVVNPCSEQMPQ